MRFYTKEHLFYCGADLLGHIQNTNSQYDLAPFGKKIAYKSHRAGVAEHFPDADVSMDSVEKGLR